MMGCRGKVQHESGVIHLIVEHVFDLSSELKRISGLDTAFPLVPGRGDEAKHGGHGPDSQAALRVRFVFANRPFDVEPATFLPRLCRSASIRLMTLSGRSGGGASSIVCPFAFRRTTFSELSHIHP
jgi:hypothetical protein